MVPRSPQESASQTFTAVFFTFFRGACKKFNQKLNLRTWKNSESLGSRSFATLTSDLARCLGILTVTCQMLSIRHLGRALSRSLRHLFGLRPCGHKESAHRIIAENPVQLRPSLRKVNHGCKHPVGHLVTKEPRKNAAEGRAKQTPGWPLSKQKATQSAAEASRSMKTHQSHKKASRIERLVCLHLHYRKNMKNIYIYILNIENM